MSGRGAEIFVTVTTNARLLNSGVASVEFSWLFLCFGDVHAVTWIPYE